MVPDVEVFSSLVPSACVTLPGCSLSKRTFFGLHIPNGLKPGIKEDPSGQVTLFDLASAFDCVDTFGKLQSLKHGKTIRTPVHVRKQY
jgi:hypothetical protein